MLASGNSAVMNGVILASAIVPVLIVIVLAWFFLRAGKRNDEREAQAEANRPSGLPAGRIHAGGDGVAATDRAAAPTAPNA